MHLIITISEADDAQAQQTRCNLSRPHKDMSSALVQLGTIKEHNGNTNLCSKVIDFIISLCYGSLVTSVDNVHPSCNPTPL